MFPIMAKCGVSLPHGLEKAHSEEERLFGLLARLLEQVQRITATAATASAETGGAAGFLGGSGAGGSAAATATATCARAASGTGAAAAAVAVAAAAVADPPTVAAAGATASRSTSRSSSRTILINGADSGVGGCGGGNSEGQGRGNAGGERALVTSHAHLPLLPPAASAEALALISELQRSAESIVQSLEDHLVAEESEVRAFDTRGIASVL